MMGLYARCFKLGVTMVLCAVVAAAMIGGAAGTNGEKQDEWTAYTKAGLAYFGEKDYDNAELEFKKALVSASKKGKESTHVATSLHNLAKLYQIQGRYLEAEPLFRKAIELYQKNLGRDHPRVKEAVNNLAILYKSRGKELDPNTVLLPDRKFNSGRTSGDTQGYSLEQRKRLGEATKMNDLGLLYKSRGNYADAEPLYLKALAIYEDVMGSEHPNVAITLGNMAQLAKSRKDYKKAEEYYLRSLAIYRKSLGPDHLAVATTLTNMGVLYGNQEDYAKAEPLFQKALAIREKSLGSEHPMVLKSLTNLAIIYENQDKYAEAKPIYERALPLARKIHGPNHPVVQDIQESLAEL